MEPRTAVAKPSRLAALDWIRFFAVTLMVQGHTFTEVLSTTVKAEPWYAWHRYVHGYTAPIFYFSSGLAFGVTTLRTWEQHLGFTKALRKRLERYAVLLLLGYAMQAGAFSLRVLLTAPRAEQQMMLAVNTLQNIGMTLLVAELLAVVLRTVARFRAALLALTLLLVLLAPAAWRWDGSGMPLFVAAYVTDRTRSIFPLLPWSAYIYAGILVAMALIGADGRTLRDHAARRLAAIGAALTLAGVALRRSGWNPFGEHVYTKTSPFFFCIRLGIIVLGFAALRALEERLRPDPDSRAVRTVQRIAAETLVIYVGHLLLLFGTPWTIGGFSGAFHESLSLGASTLVFLVVLLPMLAFALVWHGWKKDSLATFDRIRYAVTAAMILVYLLNPGF